MFPGDITVTALAVHVHKLKIRIFKINCATDTKPFSAVDTYTGYELVTSLKWGTQVLFKKNKIFKRCVKVIHGA